MEDVKIILYVLAAVAYFVFMQWRKAFNSPKDDVDAEPRTPERRPQYPAKPVTSFEDILRELQPKLEQAEARGKAVVDRSKETAQQMAAPVAGKSTKVISYEDAAPQALSWEKPEEALQAAMHSKQRRVVNKPGTLLKQTKKENHYASLLHNPSAAREAFILAEIFNRKYN